jgi:hypothetical protein
MAQQPQVKLLPLVFGWMVAPGASVCFLAIFVYRIFSPKGVLFASATASLIPVIVIVLCWMKK